MPSGPVSEASGGFSRTNIIKRLFARGEDDAVRTWSQTPSQSSRKTAGNLRSTTLTATEGVRADSTVTSRRRQGSNRNEDWAATNAGFSFLSLRRRNRPAVPSAPPAESGR
nr:uncharacterized protein LOC130540519 [Pan paniscus]